MSKEILEGKIIGRGRVIGESCVVVVVVVVEIAGKGGVCVVFLSLIWCGRRGWLLEEVVEKKSTPKNYDGSDIYNNINNNENDSKEWGYLEIKCSVT